jgi:hypothetical protein
MLLLAVTISVSVAVFTFGWLAGYNKACHAHDWNLPKFRWQ